VLVTIAVSYATKPKPAVELDGLVYGCTELPSQSQMPLVQRPLFWGIVVIAVLCLLQWLFW
jgi:SSS family solute:Na+ symporter